MHLWLFTLLVLLTDLEQGHETCQLTVTICLVNHGVVDSEMRLPGEERALYDS